MSEDNQGILEPSSEPAPVEAVEERPSWMRRTGRALRAVLIYTGMVVIAFGLGMLVTYLWLNRPLATRLTQSQAELQAARAELDQVQNQLASVQEEVLALQETNETLTVHLDRSETRIHLLRVMYQARVAQNALLNRDQASARRALQAARTELDTALPMIEVEDEEVAQSLTLRLDVAVNSMARDPTTTRADLEILINNLILLERLLAQQ
ncbi:MAG TPA: hypothetical protein VLH85_10310 [Levilinea sp.]|nr:hypothetical protein [Levilinea sp.]